MTYRLTRLVWSHVLTTLCDAPGNAAQAKTMEKLSYKEPVYTATLIHLWVEWLNSLSIFPSEIPFKQPPPECYL